MSTSTTFAVANRWAMDGCSGAPAENGGPPRNKAQPRCTRYCRRTGDCPTFGECGPRSVQVGDPPPEGRPATHPSSDGTRARSSLYCGICGPPGQPAASSRADARPTPMNVRTFAAPLVESPPTRRPLGRALSLPVADAAALVVLAMAAVASEPAVRASGRSGLLTVAVYVVFGLLAFAAYGLYRPRRVVSEATLGEVGRIAAALTASSWISFLALEFVGASILSTERLAVLWLAAVAAVAGARLAAREFSARTFGPERALVVGAGAVGQQVAARLLTAGRRRLEIVALFDPSPLPTQDERLGGLPVFDNVHDFERALDHSGATRVIFAFSQINVTETLDLVRICDRRGVDVDVVPRLFELFANGVSLDSAEGIPLLSLPPVRPPAHEVAAKRIFDLVTSAALLFVLAPVLMLITLGFRLYSPGPAICRQAR